MESGNWNKVPDRYSVGAGEGENYRNSHEVSFVRCMSFLSRSFFQSLSYNNICTFGQILSWMTFTVRNQ